MDRARLERAYEPTEIETRWAARWLAEGAFAPCGRPEHGSDSSPFVVLLPPPNVTGKLHMGHVLTNTLQDVFTRYHRMLGREVVWWPGTDHAGIATQNKVEENLRDQGVDPKVLGREGFLRHCWDWKERSHGHIVAQMQRMGWSLDWPREYFTLDQNMSHAVAEVFIRLHRKGLVYRGHYITNWCPSCRTAISDEEVEHVEKQGHLWTIRYPRTDGRGSVSVATTRPETVLGDVAVAMHPDDARAADLVGKTLRIPVLDREIPILADEYVDPEFGTGLVKITPAHDPNDFQVGKRHKLESPIVIDPDGRMNDLAGPFAGLDRFEARRRLLERLEAEGLLEKTEPHTLSIGRHDRCQTVIEPYLSNQWFVRMAPLAEPAVRAVLDERVTFYPERWRNVYLHWMRNIQDWCISRQLWWGHRIPVYECQACKTAVASHGRPSGCENCQGHDFVQDESVLDTWFSSWLCPFSPMGWPNQTADLERYHPTHLLVTGYEIIFFWVARMIMASLEFVGDVPFRIVLLNGIVRDAQGRKLSKSLGNSPDPLDLVQELGADAVRFSTVMLSPPGQDCYFEPKTLETGRHFANKIWNAARLVLTSAEDRGWVQKLGLTEPSTNERAPADPGLATLWEETFQRPLPDEIRPHLHLEDRWILHRFACRTAAVRHQLQSLRVHEAASEIYHFFWDEYCAWYLESVKPRFQAEANGTAGAAHAVALVLLASAGKLASPFMPFLAEEIWDRVPGTTGLVMTSAYPREHPELYDEAAADRFLWVVEATSALRALRSEMQVPPGKKAQVLLQTDDETGVLDSEQSALLQLHAKLESLQRVPVGPRPQDVASVVVRDQVLYVPLGGLVDLDAERRRLDKEIQKVERDMKAVEAKLGNSSFIEKAPDRVVQHERTKRSDLESRRDRLQKSLAELSGKG